MNNKDYVRSYFRKLGYKHNYNKKIKDSIVYQFDFFMKDKETLAVYVLNKEDSFSSLVDVAQMVAIFNPHLKIVLCIPDSFSLPVDAHFKAMSCNIDLYIIKNHHVHLWIKSVHSRIAEQYTLSEIEKTLLNINRICKIRFTFPLFRIRRDLLKKLIFIAKNEREYVYQITTISSILESLEYDKILAYYIPKNQEEKESFKKNQSIKVIEYILNDKIEKYDRSVIKTFRELRDLRNVPPVHPISKFGSICKKYIKKQRPTNDTEWSELSQISFNNFKGSLILLRDILK